MVQRTVCICPSLRAMTGWLTGILIVLFSVKHLRNAARPVMESCLGVAVALLVLGGSSSKSTLLEFFPFSPISSPEDGEGTVPKMLLAPL